MRRRAYSSDVSDEEWAFIAPYLLMRAGYSKHFCLNIITFEAAPEGDFEKSVAVNHTLLPVVTKIFEMREIPRLAVSIFQHICSAQLFLIISQNAYSDFTSPNELHRSVNSDIDLEKASIS